MTAAVALTALIIALAALVLAVMVARQSAAASALLDRHRNGHRLREGQPDPQTSASHRADRREVNVGPSRAVGERRASPGAALPPEETAGPFRPLPEEPPTEAMPRVRPRPGQIGQSR